jgi:hypothetical protein
VVAVVPVGVVGSVVVPVVVVPVVAVVVVPVGPPGKPEHAHATAPPPASEKTDARTATELRWILISMSLLCWMP